MDKVLINLAGEENDGTDRELVELGGVKEQTKSLYYGYGIDIGAGRLYP